MRAIHMHHTNWGRPFIIAEGRLADVRICELARRDCVFLVGKLAV
jgi:hypothetical protein